MCRQFFPVGAYAGECEAGSQARAGGGRVELSGLRRALRAVAGYMRGRRQSVGWRLVPLARARRTSERG